MRDERALRTVVAVTAGGTATYDGVADLPALVARAVALARATGFDLSSIPEQGRLLQVLARGCEGGRIGETGTGAGVGVAWLASAVGATTEIVSVEREPGLVAATRELFADHPNVTIVEGDWTRIHDHAPFDLLVVDGGGKGHDGEPIAEPRALLAPGGAIVLDDFTPMTGWPPSFHGAPDRTRLRWLEHPDLLVTEVRTTPTTASLVGKLR